MSLSIPASATRNPLALPARAPLRAWVRLGITWAPLEILMIIVVAGRALAPYNPNAIDLINKLRPPSATHLMGTDPLGRDVFSRVLTGARSTAPNVFVILISAVTAGLTIGIVAGFFGGVVDSILMHLTDVFLAFPALVLALTIIGILARHVLPNSFGPVGVQVTLISARRY